MFFEHPFFLYFFGGDSVVLLPMAAGFHHSQGVDLLDADIQFSQS
jgi:hypothetical protein